MFMSLPGHNLPHFVAYFGTYLYYVCLRPPTTLASNPIGPDSLIRSLSSFGKWLRYCICVTARCDKIINTWNNFEDFCTSTNSAYFVRVKNVRSYKQKDADFTAMKNVSIKRCKGTFELWSFGEYLFKLSKVGKRRKRKTLYYASMNWVVELEFIKMIASYASIGLYAFRDGTWELEGTPSLLVGLCAH